MIKTVNDDLFNSFATEGKIAIVHGCNAQGVMGSGVARIVRDKFSKAYFDYMAIYEKHGLNLGQIIGVEVKKDKFIINAITQEFFGRDGKFVDYDAVRKCFEAVNEFAANFEIDVIAFPKIGAGLGGGDWRIISKIIDETVDESFQKILYVYE